MPLTAFHILSLSNKNIFFFFFSAEDLDHVVYRVGMLAVLRSKSKGGKLHNRKPKCAMESYT